MQDFILTQDLVNEKVTDFLNGLETEHTVIGEYVDFEDINDFSTAFDDIERKLQDNNDLGVEIIYYSRAMDYLKENDTSLNECTRIASEMGFSTENLNSEILASLLASENNREEFAELENEIELFFENLQEEIDDYTNATIDTLTRVGENEEDLQNLDLDELTELANEMLDEIHKLDV